MRETTPVTVAESEETRCQHGNCQYESIPGTHLCRIHSGVQKTSPSFVNKATQYNLGETEYLQSLSKEVKANAEHPDLHSLRKEIGVLEVFVTRVLKEVKDDATLMLKKDQIENLYSRIESMKKSNLQLEKETKKLINKEELIQLANDLLQIVIDNLSPLQKDPKVAQAINNIADSFNEICN